jgi:hypothetical protein
VQVGPLCVEVEEYTNAALLAVCEAARPLRS